jgi:hypothetical protein
MLAPGPDGRASEASLVFRLKSLLSEDKGEASVTYAYSWNANVEDMNAAEHSTRDQDHKRYKLKQHNERIDDHVGLSGERFKLPQC